MVYKNEVLCIKFIYENSLESFDIYILIEFINILIKVIRLNGSRDLFRNDD